MGKVRIRPWRLLTVTLVGLFLLWQGVGWVSGQIGSLLLRTALAERGIIEITAKGEGVFVRTEQTIPAPLDGRVVFLVNPGQAVRSGQVVAEIAEIVDARLRSELAELDRQLIDFDHHFDQLRLDYENERDALSAQILATQSELNEALTTARQERVQQLNAQLDVLQTERDRLDAEFTQMRYAFEVERADLLERRERLTVGVIGERRTVRVEKPGEVYFSVDGLEESLTPGVRPNDWDAIRASEWQRYEDGSMAVAGEPLIRLVDPFEAFVYVQFEEFVSLQQGQRLALRSAELAGEKSVAATVHSIDNRAGGVGVWLRLDTYQQHWFELRHLAEVTLILESYQGVKVPREALYTRNESLGVFIMLDKRPVFRSVEVVGGDTDEVVVTGLPSDVSVVVNPERLGQKV